MCWARVKIRASSGGHFLLAACYSVAGKQSRASKFSAARKRGGGSGGGWDNIFLASELPLALLSAAPQALSLPFPLAAALASLGELRVCVCVCAYRAGVVTARQRKQAAKSVRDREDARPTEHNGLGENLNLIYFRVHARSQSAKERFFTPWVLFLLGWSIHSIFLDCLHCRRNCLIDAANEIIFYVCQKKM